MTTTIKMFCIAASFTLFALSTVGLEIEDTLMEDSLVEDSLFEDTYQVSCKEEQITQVLETSL